MIADVAVSVVAVVIVVVAARLLFPLQRVLHGRTPTLVPDFHHCPVVVAVVAAHPTATAADRSRLAPVDLREPRLRLPAVQRVRQRHRVDLDVLPVLLCEHYVGHARRGEHPPARAPDEIVL